MSGQQSASSSSTRRRRGTEGSSRWRRAIPHGDDILRMIYEQPMISALPYLDELDQLLLDQYDDCMLLSELDGFLTGNMDRTSMEKLHAAADIAFSV